MNNEKIRSKYPVGDRSFSSSSLVTISSLIEHIITEERGELKISHAKDIVFLNFRKGAKDNASNLLRYDKDTEIKMSFNAVSLRALSYAMKELIRNKETEYQKMTASCSLSCGLSNNGYFLNIRDISNSNKNPIGVKFDKYEFYSFSESLSILADDTERELFKHQRGIKKANKKEV